MESSIEAKIVKVSKEVDVFFDEQMKALEYLRANLKHDVTTQGQIKLKELELQKEMLTLSLAQLRSSVNFAERAIVDGDDMELLTMKQQLVQRLAQLNASQFHCKPCNSDYLKLQVDKTIWDVGKMATLLHTPVDTEKCVLSMVGGEEGVLYETFAGQPVDFVLGIKDEKADSKPKTGYEVCASVNHSRKDNLYQKLPVHDNGDGSYLFSYRPETDGLCTLSVTVEGEKMPGSPFTWKVRPEVKSAEELSLLTIFNSSLEQDEHWKGKCCWKLKFVRCLRTTTKFEIGVSCIKLADQINYFFDAEIKRCTLCHQYRKGSSSVSRTRSDSPYTFPTSVKSGDTFSVYLNYSTSKLVIYDHQRKEAEVFTGVEGEKVVPIISPFLSTGKIGNGFSLVIDA